MEENSSRSNSFNTVDIIGPPDDESMKEEASEKVKHDRIDYTISNKKNSINKVNVVDD